MRPSGVDPDAAEAIRIWRASNRHWFASETHRCSNRTCDVENLRLRVFRCGCETHHCLAGACEGCPAWCTPRTLVSTRSDLYVCRGTGALHVCSDSCDGARVINADGESICAISGIAYGGAPSSGWRAQATGLKVSKYERADPLRFQRRYDGSLRAETDAPLGGAQENQVHMAQGIIHELLYSERRLLAEQRKNLELHQESEKLVNKYRRNCDRSRRPKVFMDMVILYTNRMKRKHRYHGLIPKHIDRHASTSALTRVCVNLWNAILRTTPLGRASPNLFPLRDFVPAALYIMKQGLPMADVEIVEKNFYLEATLPEANTLDFYRINKPMFTQMKNNITRAIREAVDQRHVSPQHLRALVNAG